MTAPPSSTMPISFNELDSRQRQAVEHVRGPMLVVAGAGTGKTTVLVRRIAHLIREQHANPREILAVSYSENSARELGERVRHELRDLDVTGLKTSTFHAYCLQMLVANGRGFSPILREDLWVLLRRRISELELDRFIKAANPAEFLNDLLKFCDRCRDELVSAADYERYVQGLEAKGTLPRVSRSKESSELSRPEKLARCQEIARVYRKVEQMLAEKNLGTFGDMIVNAVRLLRDDGAVLRRQRAEARFILIDEFQDSNRAQIELAALLAGPEQNIFAVGDPDQAIYRFRGASSGAFDEFLGRFSDAKLVMLARNHRSTSSILRCAFAAISKNPEIVSASQGLNFHRTQLESAREQAAAKSGKPLPPPQPVSIVLARDSRSEAAEIAESILELHPSSAAGELKWRDCAVLYRSHVHREYLAEEFFLRDIPFAVCGLDTLQTTAARDLLAALRAICFPREAVSALRVAALPRFGIRGDELQLALDQAGRDPDIVSVLASVSGGEKVLRELERCRQFLRLGEPSPAASAVLPSAVSCFQMDATDPAILALRKFVNEWEEKPTTETRRLADFLKYLDDYVEADGHVCLPDPPDDLDAVRLLTAHAAKGLEFTHVFVVRANSNSFPSSYREPLFAFPDALRNPPPAPNREEDEKQVDSRDRSLHQQEERRLFYVAMTRARDSLTVSAKPGAGNDATPAGFLRPLMQDAALRHFLRSRPARPYRIDLAAAALSPAISSAVAGWLLQSPQKPLSGLPLSASAIETYERCPLQFKIEHQWNLPGEVVAAMQFGNAMHSVMKHYFDALRAGRELSPEEIAQYFRSTLAALPFDDPLQRQLYEKQGVAQLAAFAKSRHDSPPPAVCATERGFKIKIGGVEVQGRIDRLDTLPAASKAVAITDYKTGRPRSQKDADTSLQLSIYALAAERAWGYDPQRLTFHNLETGALVETSRSRDKLRDTEDRVRQVAENIARGNFEPNPDRHCMWCAYRSICPATEQKLYSIAKSMQAVSTGVN
jgi:DNA helicase II / ATP-dependent DNA helicase PcrA